MRIIVFDFDGTITTKDSFLEFIKFTKGKFRFYKGLVLFVPLLCAFKLKLYPNWKAKERIFSYFFKEDSMDQFNKWGEEFSHKINHIIRKKALKAIQIHLSKGDKVVIVSASIENWIYPWATLQGINDVLATKVEKDKYDKLTGRFLSANCYGQEKVNQVLKHFPNRNQYELWVYGDSRGDKELIEIADYGWYNKFK